MEIPNIPDTVTTDERLLLLAMALDTRVGLTFEEIAQKGLLGSGAQIPSLKRAFATYRRQLDEIGIHITESDASGEARYKIDARMTYADPLDIRLSRDEVVSLIALLTFYLDGSSTPYSQDVLKARAKLSSVAHLPVGREDESKLAGKGRGKGRRGEKGEGRGERGLTVGRKVGRADGRKGGRAGGPEVAKTMDAVLEAYAEQRPLSFSYTNAQGVSQRHRVAIYGLFERGDQTYFVGNDALPDAADDNGAAGGGGAEGTVKVFRVDRLDHRSVAVEGEGEGEGSYVIPADFTIENYLRLPFQYGEGEPFTATFRVSPQLTAGERDALTARKGSWDDTFTTWTVEASDLGCLARWSCGMLRTGFTPLDPPELVDAMRRGLSNTEERHG